MAVLPLIMPKLGAYTEDVLLAGWLVPEGGEVTAGAAVFELETDKTTAEVEAELTGYVHHLVAAGALVPIGATVGLVAETRAEYETAAGLAPRDAAPASAPIAEVGEDDNPFLGYIGHGGGTAVVEATAAAASNGGGGSPAHASTPAPGARVNRGRGGGPLVSPRARALLTRLGFGLEVAREITATGPGGRIVDRDVAAWAAAHADAPDHGAAPDRRVASELTVRESIPLRGRRGTIASRMVSSLQTAAQLTSVLEIDVKPLVELRARLNAGGASPRIGVTSILVKLVAGALREHPLLNARVTESAIELLEEINVAVAVETEAGLVAPVVAGADRLTIEQINARIDDLAARSRAGTLSPDELLGGTFTVSNGGIHPVDLTTAILNPPQTGILWVGRIRDRPVVVGEGAIAVRPTLQACLTFDHRAVDGGPAAAFLGALERAIHDLARLPS